ncbi:hypothetical protein OCK74_03235 [Chitinophagaceae bacterium LB-8]|uniref:Ferritin-like domain-containing protein n=1 Tax=Paraflavisolibacter caeni TaxID=2982496 RepID=A0A9X3BF22_9BACT|nr:hypothetical protein [Paraflavisolibacter caeni]MCU7548109.1 hypothetical protein [Paraflavisolibacter caeni]
MQALLHKIIEQPELHAYWLNTLSMMENVGAKKIKKCEHPIFVNEVILKHASEEARHAFYLKKQIQKIRKDACPTYEWQYLLAPKSSYAYLNQLDIDVCRYLKSKHELKHERLKYAAYLLVTYAIEVRADELYPIYQDVLRAYKSPVSVRNIIAEEQNHLEEMEKQLKAFSSEWEEMCRVVREIESKLHSVWIENLHQELGLS